MSRTTLHCSLCSGCSAPNAPKALSRSAMPRSSRSASSHAPIVHRPLSGRKGGAAGTVCTAAAAVPFAVDQTATRADRTQQKREMRTVVDYSLSTVKSSIDAQSSVKSHQQQVNHGRLFHCLFTRAIVPNAGVGRKSPHQSPVERSTTGWGFPRRGIRSLRCGHRKKNRNRTQSPIEECCCY